MLTRLNLLVCESLDLIFEVYLGLASCVLEKRLDLSYTGATVKVWKANLDSRLDTIAPERKLKSRLPVAGDC